MRKVSFKSNGKSIHGTLITPARIESKSPGVVLIHGFGSSEKNYIPLGERLAVDGIVALTVNLRGHGGTHEEQNTLHVSDGFVDGLGAYDFLVSNDFIDIERVGLCGASFGGGISAYVSGERKVKSLVLRAPATYSDVMMDQTLKELMEDEREKFNNMDNMSNTTAIKSLEMFNGSILVITSEKDSIIPLKMSKAFYEAPLSPIEREMMEIKDATHDLSDDLWREKFRSATVSWF